MDRSDTGDGEPWRPAPPVGIAARQLTPEEAMLLFANCGQTLAKEELPAVACGGSYL